ncbi:hypothetical protein ACETAC_08500 [Aceticella autotrophica]|uniref:Poly-beta-1,6-N-acetyl-D-glucosamine biosynthesis protein PgaD n=1 Tax=Aceticella autotrophica TaxID=2755338 RepID=A0A975AUY9_9THEO|nr:hypothetical protein [Aceticella autotrophica]QSZ26909.1 hypothetical protein ACETAC_08500 [Aceticella autotrophica]
MNLNTNNKTTPYNALKNRLARLLIITTTLGAWTLLFLSIIWVLGAIGWYLLARLWLKELFVPSAVYPTVTAVLAATLWAILLWCSALLWSRYHYHRYYQHNKRQLLPPTLKAQKLLWQENIIDTSKGILINPPHLKVLSDNSSYKETAASVENRENHEYYPDEVLLHGITLQENLQDETGKIILAAEEIITPKKLEKIIGCGLYGEFITKLSKQFFSEEEGR